MVDPGNFAWLYPIVLSIWRHGAPRISQFPFTIASPTITFMPITQKLIGVAVQPHICSPSRRKARF